MKVSTLNALKSKGRFWGESPLPIGAICLGSVHNGTGEGALIQTSDGKFKMGISGHMEELDQEEVKKGLAAAMLGSIKSDKKAKSSAANGNLGGRPKST